MTTDARETGARDLQWQAQALRISALWPAAEISVAEAWAEIMGAEPDTTATQKGGEQQAQGSRPSAEGDQQEEIISLVTKPDRIEWTLRAKGRGEASEEPPDLTLRSLAEALASVTDIGKRWIASKFCPTAQRLALGAMLLAPVQDRQEGYRKLAPYLPGVEIDPEGSRDFFYQVNRPRVTHAPGFDLVVNRLSKWSVAFFKTIVVGFGRDGKPPTSRGRAESFACHLVLDINTDQDYAGELGPDEMRALLVEFASLATEISKEGDTA